jgi:hypothetical protein
MLRLAVSVLAVLGSLLTGCIDPVVSPFCSANLRTFFIENDYTRGVACVSPDLRGWYRETTVSILGLGGYNQRSIGYLSLDASGMPSGSVAQDFGYRYVPDGCSGEVTIGHLGTASLVVVSARSTDGLVMDVTWPSGAEERWTEQETASLPPDGLPDGHIRYRWQDHCGTLGLDTYDSFDGSGIEYCGIESNAGDAIRLPLVWLGEGAVGQRPRAYQRRLPANQELHLGWAIDLDPKSGSGRYEAADLCQESPEICLRNDSIEMQYVETSMNADVALPAIGVAGWFSRVLEYPYNDFLQRPGLSGSMLMPTPVCINPPCACAGD